MNKVKVPACINAVMLLVAMADLPYGYYQILRWVTCGISIFVAYQAYTAGKTWATWLFGLIAVLFNPIIPVYLTKEIWRPIDLISAMIFLGILFLSTSAKKSS